MTDSWTDVISGDWIRIFFPGFCLVTVQSNAAQFMANVLHGFSVVHQDQQMDVLLAQFTVTV